VTEDEFARLTGIAFGGAGGNIEVTELSLSDGSGVISLGIGNQHETGGGLDFGGTHNCRFIETTAS
jgi:hypothetical protein